MKFHFVRMKPTRGFMTLTDPTSKTRALCFKTPEVAEKYILYLSNFRSTNGVWPNLDMTQEISVIRKKVVKARTPEEISKFMEVVVLDRDELDDLGRVHGMSFLYVIDFDTNGLAISFKGQEIDGFANPEDYANNLELRVL